MSWRTRVLAVLTALAAVAVAVPADAAVIWDGDAARGTGVFGQLNCDAPGTVDDATHGKVWRYHKPSGDRRCETHGISTGNGKYAFHNGSTYYFGWWSTLSSTVNNNANFQWKSYGQHIQNCPVVLKMIDGRITMIQRQPENKVYTVWSAPMTANSWHHYVEPGDVD